MCSIDGQLQKICSWDALLAHCFKTDSQFVGRGRCNELPRRSFVLRSGGVPCHPLLGLQSTGSRSWLCRSSSSSSLGSASNSPSAIAASVRSLPRYSSHSALRRGPTRSMILLRTILPCPAYLAEAEAGAIGTQNPRRGQRPALDKT